MLAVIGTGRVAMALGRALVERGEAVRWIAGRDPGRTSLAAAFIGGGARPSSIDTLPRGIRHTLIAVSDEALPEVSQRLADAGCCEHVALHTSGAWGPEALASLAARGLSCGALHPLQTVASAAQGVATLPGCTFGVTAEGAAREWARHIIDTVGGRELLVAPAARPLYHAAAVIASNYPASLLAAATALLQRAGVSGESAAAALAPLMRTAIDNLLRLGLPGALTGPVVRGDTATIARHLQAIRSTDTDGKEWFALYRAGAQALLSLAIDAGTPPERVAAIARLLHDTEERDDG